MTSVNEDDRNNIEELLPWHAAGTLSRRDAQRVEAALANDSELARRYELVREELGQNVTLNETLGAPSPRVMDELFARIDAEPARRRAAAKPRRSHRRIPRRPHAAHARLVGSDCRDCDPAAGRLHRRHRIQRHRRLSRPLPCPATATATAPTR